MKLNNDFYKKMYIYKSSFMIKLKTEMDLEIIKNIYYMNKNASAFDKYHSEKW